ncbi:MAG: VCBS repeat-containing protein [Candidatus Cloacimonetes bacterium]|nr:VCBS repeat-containing protein [Candidatus Cloacimonadota bacterium]MBL7149515.1 VCBS repeat-containing protein [Candidatus Cloacimonadota bacterium]
MRYIILFFLSLIIFTPTFAAEYIVPRAAYSVYAEDLDLDGDKDIVVGHKYNSQTDWGGVSILGNNGNGEFELIDSLFFNNGFAYVNGNYIDNDNYIDIFGQYVSDDPAPINNRFIGIIYNYGYQSFNNIIYFPLNTREPVPDITSGDIDNDNDIDIIVASNNGQFWGVLCNNGTGQFSSPEYHYVTGYYPVDIACGNLNEDNRNDIAICAQKTEVYFSYETGF